MKKTLTAAELNELLPCIFSAIASGKRWEAKQSHYPAGAIIEAVLSIDGMEKDDSDEDSNDGFTTNGWQYDWWQQFLYRGKPYTLSGSGFYGGHAFSLSDQ